MFEMAKTLIVVYKDEMLMNPINKMVEAKDDGDEQIVDPETPTSILLPGQKRCVLAIRKPGSLKISCCFG